MNLHLCENPPHALANSTKFYPYIDSVCVGFQISYSTETWSFLFSVQRSASTDLPCDVPRTTSRRSLSCKPKQIKLTFSVAFSFVSDNHLNNCTCYTKAIIHSGLRKIFINIPETNIHQFIHHYLLRLRKQEV